MMNATECMTQRDWAAMSADECDRQAWEAIRRWPFANACSVVNGGIDFAHATRWYLWDKVGRAIRSCAGHGTLERSVQPSNRICAAHVGIQAKVGLASRLRSRALRARLAAQRASQKRRVLYCPFPFSRHARIMDALIGCDREYEIVVPESFVAAWPGTIGVTPSRQKPQGHSAFVESLVADTLSGLAQEGVSLLTEDQAVLKDELLDFAAFTAVAKSDLARLRPDAVLVPSDNTPPFSALVHAARSLDIAVVMVQHGMDCERHCLDDAYATHIASWGAYRRERYEADSEFSPTMMRDIGNPFYDDPGLEALKGLGVKGRWLWVTRPHVSEKCYAPSRREDEGIQIFDALADALETCVGTHLQIKCHAFDYAERYEARIHERGLEDRVAVVSGAIMQLLSEAQIVISEDSTAGMDAMLLGKPVVHAHFAESQPVMPFVDFGAALPGRSQESLVSAVHAATSFSDNDLKTMQAKQAEFLDYAAGPRDGNAAKRFCEFVADVIG